MTGKHTLGTNDYYKCRRFTEFHSWSGQVISQYDLLRHKYAKLWKKYVRRSVKKYIYLTSNFDEKLIMYRFLKKYMFCDDVIKMRRRVKSLGERKLVFVKSCSFSMFFLVKTWRAKFRLSPFNQKTFFHWKLYYPIQGCLNMLIW